MVEFTSSIFWTKVPWAEISLVTLSRLPPNLGTVVFLSDYLSNKEILGLLRISICLKGR